MARYLFRKGKDTSDYKQFLRLNFISKLLNETTNHYTKISCIQVNLWKKEQSAFKDSNSKEVNDSDDSKEQLIAQVEHYKGVLGETVRNDFLLVTLNNILSN